jgi:transcription termination factor 2
MGLGKTLTVISLILKHAQQTDEEQAESDEDSYDEDDEDEENAWSSKGRKDLKQGGEFSSNPRRLH